MEANLKEAIVEAEEFLQEAEWLFMGGFYRGLINRCYYSYFWIVRGLLAEHNINPKSHAGIHNKFGEIFIKTGEIPQHFNTYLVRLSQKREKADYDLDDVHEKDDAIFALKMVKEFLEFTKEKYIIT